MEEKRNRQQCMNFSMVRPMINLPHYWDKLSHLTNISGRTFEMKVLRMRR